MKSIIVPCILSRGSSELIFSDCETQKASADNSIPKNCQLTFPKETSGIESVTHVSIPIILTCPNFPDTYQMCVKYKVLNCSSKHSVHQNVNIQEKSYKCNQLGKMIHESSQCTLYNKSDTAENCSKHRSSNHRDASIKHQT